MEQCVKSQKFCLWAIVFISCGLMAGCGPSDGLSRASLTGKVTYRGRPLEHGLIGLLPTGETKGPQGSAAIGPDGTYEITTAGKPGAVVGTHKVVVQCREQISPEEAKQMKIGRLLIPSRYATYDDSPLEVDVTEGGTVFNIELVD